MQKTGSWEIHKFGGTSVQGAERYCAVADILVGLPKGLKRGVVVSAMKGVTDALIETVKFAVANDALYLDKFVLIKKRHCETIGALFPSAPEWREKLNACLDVDFKKVEEILRGIWLSKTASEQLFELISGYGEVWSAQFLNALLQSQGVDSDWIDAREILIIESREGRVDVQWEASSQHLSNWLQDHTNQICVITGFVASTPQGIATTLGRNGSDFSASIFGALFEALEITIWTDVDGVFSADPRLVPDAVSLDELSYNEVTELAYFGAQIVHPATMEPAIRRNTPIYIRNTFNPSFKGTKIHAEAKSDRLVKGFSAIRDMALINLEGTGMVGVPGIAERLFASLRSAGVSVVMISQASSEHSICLAVLEFQAKLAKTSIEKAFYAELHLGLIQQVQVTMSCSILAMVGDNMVNHPGLAGRFFGALGLSNINVQAIAQGSSERNISTVISSKDTTKALRSVHSTFYLSNHTISVGIIGTGLISSALLRQLQKQSEFLRKERRIDLRVRALMNSKTMLLDHRKISLEDWETKLNSSPLSSDFEKFVAHLQSGDLPHSMIIDATASDQIPLHYPQWLEAGINIVTPNKKANTLSYSFYEQLRQVARKKNRYFLYSTNVGAGLPIIQTLRDLHYTGDQILEIQGIFSGTLSYIFNSLSPEKNFSDVVKEARARGFTEPDPREDLSGMDVARKLVILAREMGLKIQLEDVQVQSLVPLELRSMGLDEYLQKLPAQDPSMRKQLKELQEKDQVLRYVGRLNSEGEATVELKAFSKTHLFASLQGSENIVTFQTIRYNVQPLVIRGPGAGPEVTAAGVFADILRFTSYLGAP